MLADSIYDSLYVHSHGDQWAAAPLLRTGVGLWRWGRDDVVKTVDRDATGFTSRSESVDKEVSSPRASNITISVPSLRSVPATTQRPHATQRPPQHYGATTTSLAQPQQLAPQQETISYTASSPLVQGHKDDTLLPSLGELYADPGYYWVRVMRQWQLRGIPGLQSPSPGKSTFPDILPCPRPQSLPPLPALLSHLHPHCPPALTTLNAEQLQAVLAPLAPLMVIAAAGSGKTHTLSTRISHLLLQGTPPENILAVTFTRKAAEEIRSRVAQSVEQVYQSVARADAGKPPMTVNEEQMTELNIFGELPSTFTAKSLKKLHEQEEDIISCTDTIKYESTSSGRRVTAVDAAQRRRRQLEAAVEASRQHRSTLALAAMSHSDSDDELLPSTQQDTQTLPLVPYTASSSPYTASPATLQRLPRAPYMGLYTATWSRDVAAQHAVYLQSAAARGVNSSAGGRNTGDISVTNEMDDGLDTAAIDSPHHADTDATTDLNGCATSRTTGLPLPPLFSGPAGPLPSLLTLRLTVGTLHQVALRVLRQFPTEAGFTARPTVCSQSLQVTMLERCVVSAMILRERKRRTGLGGVWVGGEIGFCERGREDAGRAGNSDSDSKMRGVVVSRGVCYRDVPFSYGELRKWIQDSKVGVVVYACCVI